MSLRPLWFLAACVVALSCAPSVRAQGVVISESQGRTRTVTAEEFRTMKVLRYEVWCYGDRNTVAWIYDGRTADAARRSFEEARRVEAEGRRHAGNTPPTEWTRALGRAKGPIAIVDGEALRRQQQAAEELKRANERKEREEAERIRREKEKEKAAAEARAQALREAQQKQAEIRAEIERKRNEVERARRDAEMARQEREQAAERTRIVEDALQRAQAMQNAGNAFADAFRQINDLIQEKMERDEARRLEREAQARLDRLEEQAEQAAREERELEERLREREEIDDVRLDTVTPPEPFQTDPSGLRIKPDDAPEMPPVFPTASGRSGFNYGALVAASESDDGGGGSARGGGSLTSALLRAFGGDDDASAPSGGEPTEQREPTEQPEANGGGTSALSRLLGGRVKSDGGDADDQGAGGQNPGAAPRGSALQRLFGRGGGAESEAPDPATAATDDDGAPPSALQALRNRVSSTVTDAKKAISDSADRLGWQLPPGWRDSLLNWVVTNRYEDVRNKRLFGPEVAKQMDRRGYINLGYELYIDNAGDEIPLEAREAYYRHRILLGWLTRDVSGTANAYKDYVEKMFIDQLPDANKKEEDKK